MILSIPILRAYGGAFDNFLLHGVVYPPTGQAAPRLLIQPCFTPDPSAGL